MSEQTLRPAAPDAVEDPEWKVRLRNGVTVSLAILIFSAAGGYLLVRAAFPESREARFATLDEARRGPVEYRALLPGFVPAGAADVRLRVQRVRLRTNVLGTFRFEAGDEAALRAGLRRVEPPYRARLERRVRLNGWPLRESGWTCSEDLEGQGFELFQVVSPSADRSHAGFLVAVHWGGRLAAFWPRWSDANVQERTPCR